MNRVGFDIERREWLTAASHFLTDALQELSVSEEISADTSIAMSALLAEIHARYPRQWSSLGCEKLLGELNATSSVSSRNLREFRNRLLGLLKGVGGKCMTDRVWESRTLKLTEARPLMKKLQAMTESFRLEPELVEVEGHAVLRVKFQHPRLFLCALETLTLSNKYQIL